MRILKRFSKTSAGQKLIGFIFYFITKLIFSVPEKGIYHCAGDEVMSWFDFANKIVKENNYSNKIDLYCNYRKKNQHNHFLIY